MNLKRGPLPKLGIWVGVVSRLATEPDCSTGEGQRGCREMETCTKKQIIEERQRGEEVDLAANHSQWTFRSKPNQRGGKEKKGRCR